MQAASMADLDSWYGTPHIANPYDKLHSWQGTPDYGGAYQGYLAGQQQPLPLSRLVSMVRDIQQGMLGVPIGNQSVPMAPTTQMQMPGEIAENMMGEQNKLISRIREVMGRSGMHDPESEPYGSRYSTFEPAQSLIEAPPSAYQPSGVSGGVSGGGFGQFGGANAATPRPSAHGTGTSRTPAAPAPAPAATPATQQGGISAAERARRAQNTNNFLTQYHQ